MAKPEPGSAEEFWVNTAPFIQRHMVLFSIPVAILALCAGVSSSGSLENLPGNLAGGLALIAWVTFLQRRAYGRYERYYRQEILPSNSIQNPQIPLE